PRPIRSFSRDRNRFTEVRPGFPPQRACRNGHDQSADGGRRLSRAVRRYAQVELRRSRARVRGGRILYPDQNRLHLELTTCPTRPPNVRSTPASRARECWLLVGVPASEQELSKRSRARIAMSFSSTSMARTR